MAGPCVDKGKIGTTECKKNWVPLPLGVLTIGLVPYQVQGRLISKVSIESGRATKGRLVILDKVRNLSCLERFFGTR